MRLRTGIRRPGIDAAFLAQNFVKGENVYDVDASTWQAAFRYIDQRLDSLVFERGAVHSLWTESGGNIRDKIRDDSLVLRILRKALPGYQGPSLALYRGECRFLYEQGKIGFCWTPMLDVGALFASGRNAIESGGVLLKAVAPPEAILAGPNDHSALWMREFEYTCDPTELRDVVVIQSFPKLER
jgi:hypothetical protein